VTRTCVPAVGAMGVVPRVPLELGVCRWAVRMTAGGHRGAAGVGRAQRKAGKGSKRKQARVHGKEGRRVKKPVPVRAPRCSALIDFGPPFPGGQRRHVQHPYVWRRRCGAGGGPATSPVGGPARRAPHDDRSAPDRHPWQPTAPDEGHSSPHRHPPHAGIHQPECPFTPPPPSTCPHHRRGPASVSPAPVKTPARGPPPPRCAGAPLSPT